MTLSQAQIERLKLEDGLIDSPCPGLDFDPDADRILRAQVREVLLPSTVPKLADSVMRRIGVLPIPVADSIDEEAPGTQRVADAVMEHLNVRDSVPVDLKAAVFTESGEMESVWPAVATAIGADVQPSLGAMLRGAVEQESGAVPHMDGMGRRRPWMIPAAAGVVVAAAAALLLWVGSQSPGPERMAEKAATGPVDIEALDVGAANAVQVLQMGEEAPTIILVQPEEAAE